ncbi:hypothetical protein [Thermoflexus sp.]|uniref:hypothetical protein n=1 Tax=Thermoflexus sp. TaxID=1969742 RepID=UPI0035E40E2E
MGRRDAGFTVRDFQDLLELLRRHPERRHQLWALLAGEELLRFPAEFQAFREETERRFAELREEVAAARAEADRRFAELAEAQRRTEETVRKLVETTQRMNQQLEHHAADLGELKTRRLEAFYHQRAAFAFHPEAIPEGSA